MIDNDKIDEAIAVLKIGWTKDSLAKDSGKYNVHPESENACEWCAMGAIFKVCESSDVNAYDLIEEIESKVTKHKPKNETKAILAWINDNAESADEVIEFLESCKV